MVNTILTDDERPKLPPAKNYLGDDASWGYDASDMEAYADEREAAVLAKLREQEPVRDERAAFERALSANPDARFWNTSDAMFWAWQSRAAIAAPLPAVVPQDERAAFEEWARGYYLRPLTVVAGLYAFDCVQQGWDAWQARSRSPAPEAPALPAEVREALKVAREALEVGLAYTYECAERFHIEMRGYKQKRHDAMDAEVAQIRAALARIDALGGGE